MLCVAAQQPFQVRKRRGGGSHATASALFALVSRPWCHGLVLQPVLFPDVAFPAAGAGVQQPLPNLPWVYVLHWCATASPQSPLGVCTALVCNSLFPISLGCMYCTGVQQPLPNLPWVYVLHLCATAPPQPPLG
eukprot:358599-Chlamydomonas_euryale.AAC.1